jgi:hypothetical protein
MKILVVKDDSTRGNLEADVKIHTIPTAPQIIYLPFSSIFSNAARALLVLMFPSISLTFCEVLLHDQHPPISELVLPSDLSLQLLYKEQLFTKIFL